MGDVGYALSGANDRRLEVVESKVSSVEKAVSRIDERQAHTKDRMDYLVARMDSFHADNTKQHTEVREALGKVIAYQEASHEVKLIRNRWLRWGITTVVGIVVVVVGWLSKAGG